MRGDSRGCHPWVHFFGWDPKSWREGVIGGHEKINKAHHSGEVSRMLFVVSRWTAEDSLIPRTNRLAACCL